MGSELLERWPGYNEQSWKERFLELDRQTGGDLWKAAEALIRSRTITKEQVEDCAAALYAFDPVEQQETDLDFRPTSPVYRLTWHELIEMDDIAGEHFREQALAAARAFGLTVEG